MFASNPRGHQSFNHKLLDAVSFDLLFSQALVCYSEWEWPNRSHTNDTRNWCILSHFVALGPKYIQKLFKRVMLGIAQKKLSLKLIFFPGLPQPGSDRGHRLHTFNIFASAAFIHRPYMQDTEIRYGLGPTSRETFCKKSLCCAQYTN